MFREYIDIVAEQDKAKDEEKDKGKDREYSYNDPADLDKRIPVDEEKDEEQVDEGCSDDEEDSD